MICLKNSDTFKLVTINNSNCKMKCVNSLSLFLNEQYTLHIFVTWSFMLGIFLILVLSELNERSGWCSWTLSSSEDKTTMIVPEEIMRLSSEICLSLGCGDVYKIRTRDEGFNNTCLTGCLYHNTELNCSQAVRNGCRTLSEVVCGKPNPFTFNMIIKYNTFYL